MTTTELAAPAAPAAQKTRRYDKIHATYWWEIKLNPNWRGATGEYNRQPVLDGYSKIQGFDEAKDKREVLMGCLVRLRKYVDRCITWEIHRKASTYVDRETDPIILTLTPQNFSAAPSVIGDYALMHFLNRYYQFVRDGKDVQMLLPKKRASFTKDEYLNIDLQHAHIMGDMHRLNAYVERLSANSHPVGAIINFYNGYINKYCRSILALTKAFFILLVMCCFSSCAESNVETKTTDIQVGSYITKIKVVEIDSCEYLWGDWGNATVLTHKGNCKYCAKRSLK